MVKVLPASEADSFIMRANMSLGILCEHEKVHKMPFGSSTLKASVFSSLYPLDAMIRSFLLLKKDGGSTTTISNFSPEEQSCQAILNASPDINSVLAETPLNSAFWRASSSQSFFMSTPTTLDAPPSAAFTEKPPV